MVLRPATQPGWATDTTNFVVKGISLEFWHLASDRATWFSTWALSAHLLVSSMAFLEAGWERPAVLNKIPSPSLSSNLYYIQEMSLLAKWILLASCPCLHDLKITQAPVFPRLNR